MLRVVLFSCLVVAVLAGGCDLASDEESPTTTAAMPDVAGRRYALIVMGGHIDTTDTKYPVWWDNTYGTYRDCLAWGYLPDDMRLLAYGPLAEEHSGEVFAPSTTKTIYSSLEWLTDVCIPTDLVYVLWVGHGASHYFKTYDGWISHRTLGTHIRGIPAGRVVGVYTPCYSGAIVPWASQTNVVTVTACGADEETGWGWASEWRRALRGDGDFNSDRTVTVTEAFEWTRRVAVSLGVRETPLLDGDGVVDLQDIREVLSYYGTVYSGDAGE